MSKDKYEVLKMFDVCEGNLVSYGRKVSSITLMFQHRDTSIILYKISQLKQKVPSVATYISIDNDEISSMCCTIIAERKDATSIRRYFHRLINRYDKEGKYLKAYTSYKEKVLDMYLEFKNFDDVHLDRDSIERMFDEFGDYLRSHI